MILFHIQLIRSKKKLKKERKCIGVRLVLYIAWLDC